MAQLSIHDRVELERSLKAWKARLAAERAAAVRERREWRAAVGRRAKAYAMVKRRTAQLRRLRGGFRGRIVAAAQRDLGIIEHGNRSPRVDAMARRFGALGIPWCGAAVGTWIEEAGGDVTPRILYCPFIVEDGRKGVNGIGPLVWEDKFLTAKPALAGDLVVFDFGGKIAAHVGILRKPWDGDGPLYTIEGNTSPEGGGGSQDNGGGCWARTRTAAQLKAIVRVKVP